MLEGLINIDVFLFPFFFSPPPPLSRTSHPTFCCMRSSRMPPCVLMQRITEWFCRKPTPTRPLCIPFSDCFDIRKLLITAFGVPCRSSPPPEILTKPLCGDEKLKARDMHAFCRTLPCGHEGPPSSTEVPFSKGSVSIGRGRMSLSEIVMQLLELFLFA